MANGDTQISAEEFAAKVKAQYPDYAHIPDQELTAKMLQKYPEYAPKVMAPGVAESRKQFTNAPMPTSFGASVAAKAAPGLLATKESAAADIKKGQAEAVAERNKPAWQHAIDATAMLGGPAAIRAIPSAAQAGEAIAGVERLAAHEAVHMHGVIDALDRALQLGERGNQAPKVINDLRKAIDAAPRLDTAGGATPFLAFKEARDFFSSLSRQSSAEVANMTGPMKRQVVEVYLEMGKRLSEAAKRVGPEVAKTLKSAIKEYSRAQGIANRAEKVQDLAWKAILTGAVGAAGYRVFEALK
jgi:hypothetical protein